MSVDTRELLAKLQRDVEDEFAIYTARGASLDFVQQLVARELCVEMKIVSPTIGAALVELFTRGGWDVSFGTNAVEEQFNHIWLHRAAGLGTSEFLANPHIWTGSVPE